MHKLKALLHPTFALVCGLLGSACVDEFKGANIQIDFAGGIPAQVRQGVAPIMPLQLPTNTHYSLYGTRETRDSSGAVIDSKVTEIQRFEIHRIIERDSPCFIDPEEARYPGLHVTKYLDRLQKDTGILDIANPPSGATEEDLIDVATAMQRKMNVDALGAEPTLTPAITPGGLKAITSVSLANYPGFAPQCVEDNPSVDRNLIPPINCMGDESNKIRLDACNRFWAANPDFYEGTDRVLTEPLAGQFFGIVTGVNPINGAVLGGSQFFTEDPAIGYNAYSVVIQFDDANGDGMPDVPAFPGLGRTLLGGSPVRPTRSVTRVYLTTGTGVADMGTDSYMSIFSDLGDDDVHF